MQCLIDSLEPKYEVYKYAPYTFLIYPDGLVTLEDGTVICETGGKPCLDKWLLDNLFEVVTKDVNGEPEDFKIFKSGRVEDMNGNVICKTGGEPCLDAYLLSLIPEKQTY